MMTERFSRTILDHDGHSHSFELGSDFPMLDGERCEMVSIGPDAIRLAAFSHPTHVLSFAPDAFWKGLVGDRPTAAEAGQLFAHYIAQWATSRACTRTIAALQSLLTVHDHAPSCQDLFLPTYRFDAVTRQILESFDGTEETTRFLARILNQDQTTVVHWAQLAGKRISVHLMGNEGNDVRPPQCAEATSLPVMPEPKAKPPHFRWTAEMVEQLVTVFNAHEGMSVSTIAREMATCTGWPRSAITYKIYELKLPQQKRARQEQAQVESLGEDQQAELSQNEPDQEPDLVLQQAEIDAATSVVEAADTPQEEPVFRWDDEKVRQLTLAFMQSEAPSTSAACRQIAEQFGWPLTRVMSKVGGLRLPGRKQNRQRAAATQQPKVMHENELAVGHFVWRVVVDGNLTQWRLDYPYGNFPEHLVGAEILYQECLYHVDRILIQELRLSTVINQSVARNDSVAIPVAVGA